MKGRHAAIFQVSSLKLHEIEFRVVAQSMSQPLDPLDRPPPSASTHLRIYRWFGLARGVEFMTSRYYWDAALQGP